MMQKTNNKHNNKILI